MKQYFNGSFDEPNGRARFNWQQCKYCGVYAEAPRDEPVLVAHRGDCPVAEIIALRHTLALKESHG